MANLATGIVVTAGVMTFTNEWYQTKQVSFRILIATALAGAGIDALAALDNKAAVGLAIIVFVGAATTKFNGKSVADTVTSFFTQASTTKQGRPTVVRKVA